MDNSSLILQHNSIANLSQDSLLTHASGLMDAVLDYKELMLEYTCAIRTVKAKLETLDTEFALRYSRNPISSIHTRLKSQTSIMQKMARKHIPITRQNIEDNLNDIAGIRVICSYIDDIYLIADALTAQDDIDLLEKKDYIENPKPNGYRSLHLIVRVPVFFSDTKKHVKAEIQIRTIAMDFWASLEHGIKYKKSGENAEEIIAGLKECADVISATDEKMMNLRLQMDEVKADPTEAEIILEKLKRFDTSL